MKVFCVTLFLSLLSVINIIGQQPAPTPSDAEQKKKAEYEKKVAEVNAKNAEIDRLKGIVFKSLNDGNIAFKNLDYTGAVAEYDKGLAADPAHPGAAVLLMNKAAALRMLAVNSFNEANKIKDPSEKGIKRDLALKTINNSVESIRKAVAMLNGMGRPVPAAEAATYDSNMYKACSGLFEALRVAKKMGKDIGLEEISAAYSGLIGREKDSANIGSHRASYAALLLDYRNQALLLPEFEKLLAADPRNPDALWGAGRSLISLGFEGRDLDKVKRSAAYFERLLESAPEGYKYRNDAKRFYDAIKASPGDFPNIPPEAAIVASDEFENLVKSAFELYQNKKYEEALAAASEASKMRPGDFRPYYTAGLVYTAQWKMKSASESFAKAISFAPDNKGLYYLKSWADRRRNAKEEAIAAAQQAIKIDPAYAEAYEALADAQSIGEKKYEEVIGNYRKAIELKPGLLSAYTPLGMFLSLAKDDKGAEEIYRKAMELDPKKMACRFHLGRLLVKLGRLEEARAIWNARSSDKDNTFPNFITLLERAEKFKQATDNLAKKPNDPEALLEMGLIVMDGESWMVDGRQDRAMAYFRKALEIKPDFAKAQYAICKAYAELASYDETKNKPLDLEIEKLRQMDTKLAAEITEYRKNYSKGLLKAGPGTSDQ